jgi:hypothetical protein
VIFLASGWQRQCQQQLHQQQQQQQQQQQLQDQCQGLRMGTLVQRRLLSSRPCLIQLLSVWLL